MTVLQFLTSKDYGCCTTSELMALSKEDKLALERLKQYAREEMTRKGVELSA